MSESSFLDQVAYHAPRVRQFDTSVGVAAGGAIGLLYHLLRKKKPGDDWKTALKRTLVGAGIGAGVSNVVGDRARRYISNTTRPQGYEDKLEQMKPQSWSRFLDAAIKDKIVNPTVLADINQPIREAVMSRDQQVRLSMGLPIHQGQESIFKQTGREGGHDVYDFDPKYRETHKNDPLSAVSSGYKAIEQAKPLVERARQFGVKPEASFMGMEDSMTTGFGNDYTGAVPKERFNEAVSPENLELGAGVKPRHMLGHYDTYRDKDGNRVAEADWTFKLKDSEREFAREAWDRLRHGTYGEWSKGKVGTDSDPTHGYADSKEVDLTDRGAVAKNLLMRSIYSNAVMTNEPRVRLTWPDDTLDPKLTELPQRKLLSGKPLGAPTYGGLRYQPQTYIGDAAAQSINSLTSRPSDPTAGGVASR